MTQVLYTLLINRKKKKQPKVKNLFFQYFDPPHMKGTRQVIYQNVPLGYADGLKTIRTLQDEFLDAASPRLVAAASPPPNVKQTYAAAARLR